MVDRKYKQILAKQQKEQKSIDVNAQTLSKFIVGTITSPFTVLGTSLQLSIIPNKDFYGSQQRALQKVTLVRDYSVMVQEKQFNEVQFRAGLSGENRPFRAPIYAGYGEAAKGLAAQGYQGFFKGNVAGVMQFFIQTYVNITLQQQLGIYKLPQQNIVTLMIFGATLSVSEIITQPIRVCQTRFILQNRLPSFSTYRSLYRFFTGVKLREYMQG